ncbi:MAG TPA: DUF4097 family beta strand repeat-containing protein [Candidatus Tyrphobacter sp.]
MVRLAAISAMAGSLVLAGCISTDFGGDHVRATVHERIAVVPNAHVSIENVSGQITVIPWSRSTVDIVAVKHASDPDGLRQVTVEVTRDRVPASDVEIKTQYANHTFSFWRHSGSVDYTIHVPRGVSLRLANVSGDVQANGIVGDVAADEVSGDVAILDNGGNVTVHTVSGSIDVSMTTMGSDRRANLEAVSGSIRLAIPRNSGAVVSAHSISGGFHSDFPIPTHPQTVGTSAGGSIGNGAGSIDMGTISGSMTLEKRS